MNAPLIFSSARESVNILRIFKIVLSMVFSLKCAVPKIRGAGGPIVEY